MEIRLLTDRDDFRAVGRVYAESWRHAYRGIVPQPYLDSLTADRWARPTFPALVLLDGGEIVGISAFCPARAPEMAGWGEVVSLYLLPSHMGRGLGRQLLAAALQQLRAMGFDRAYLWVLAENAAARRFYESCGLRPSGRTTELEIAGKSLREVQYISELS